jgi:hypothetical protein
MRHVQGYRLKASAWFALVSSLLSAPSLLAQNAAIEGRIRTETGRAVAAATVILTAPPDTTPVRVADTDVLGRFRLPGVAPGIYLLTARRIGYGEASVSLTVAGEDVRADLAMEERAVALPGVAVEVDRERQRFEQDAGVTARELTRDEMKRIPGVAESDVLRAIEVLPGVVSTSDYTSAFNVRGGSADQNLILIDGFPIYNPFHLGGLFSVFNSDIVARAELLAGGFPVEHGGRVASVLNIESDAAGTGTTFDMGISLLAARAAVGAAVPDVISNALGLRSARARFSARRSYFDQVFRPFFEFPYHLTDLQTYIEGWTAGGARLSISAYTGRDVLDLAGIDSFPLQLRWNWGNDVVGARWTAPIGTGHVLDLRAGYSRFATSIHFPDYSDTRFRSHIGQWILRADLESRAGSVAVKTGLSADRLTYDNLARTGGTVFREGAQGSWLLGLYGQARLEPGPWRIELGGRLDIWPDGARNANSDVVASPRIAIKRFLGANAALKVAAGRYTQFQHSIRDEELPLGIDVWVISGDRAPRTISDQVQAGIEFFPRAGWYASLEVYDRRMDGVAANNLADDPNDIADDLLVGSGRSYGVDLFVRRDQGSVRPALAVSWLRATRKFEDPTFGLVPPPVLEYAPIFDRRLDLEFTLQTTLPGNVDASLRWNYGTGLPYTRPLAGYNSFSYHIIGSQRKIDDTIDELSIVLGPRNGQRYPAYHRMDIGFRKTYQKSWGQIRPYVDLLNVYNRRNPLFYFYEYDFTPARRSGISMFPFLPTLGAEVSF